MHLSAATQNSTAAIAGSGNTACTATAATHPSRIVHTSERSTYVSSPTGPENVSRIVGGLLLLEGN
jgi:hypothetical protein